MKTLEQLRVASFNAWDHHIKAAAKHPHHYVTAALVTFGLWLLGHGTEALAAWIYAICESVVQGGEPS